MCVDYRVLNSLLPPVNKAHSKAKGILTLVPLPKIDEIYAQLKGSKVYSAIDMRSGYFHLGLSKDAKPKTAFVPGGPMELNMNLIGVLLDYPRLQLTFRDWYMKS